MAEKTNGNTKDQSQIRVAKQIHETPDTYHREIKDTCLALGLTFKVMPVKAGEGGEEKVGTFYYPTCSDWRGGQKDVLRFLDRIKSEGETVDSLLTSLVERRLRDDLSNSARSQMKGGSEKAMSRSFVKEMNLIAESGDEEILRDIAALKAKHAAKARALAAAQAKS